MTVKAFGALLYFSLSGWGVSPGKFSVQGVVLRPDGRPASSARVILFAETETKPLFRRTRTDKEGKFRFLIPSAPLLDGYLVAFQKGFGFAWVSLLPVRKRFVLRLSYPEGITVRFKGGRVTKVRFVGIRVRGAKKRALVLPEPSKQFPFRFQTRPDRKGLFVFHALPSRTIATLMAIQRVGERAFVRWVFEVPVGKEITLSLPPLSGVEGSVVRQDKKGPVGGVQVRWECLKAQDSWGKPMALTVGTDKKGRFRIVVPAGRWVVWVPGGGTVEWVSVPKVVEVLPTKRVKVTVFVQRPGIVRGWVADAKTRFPHFSLTVKARLLGKPFPVVTDPAQDLPEGAYEIRLPDGRWELFVAEKGWVSEPVQVDVERGAVVEAMPIFVRRLFPHDRLGQKPP